MRAGGARAAGEGASCGDVLLLREGGRQGARGDGFAGVWKRGHFGWEYKGKGTDLEAAYHQLLDCREVMENPPLLLVSDIDRIVARTNSTGTRAQRHEIPLAALGEPRSLEILRALFFELLRRC
ncbi:MAG: hypothetical protein KJ058_13420 [Thermoanaerobaculia bacterium]|nr:hypothetical protein [Thermoanaerobaculia bacterium]MCZ7650917.1 hypothetical protein [Thermoanaerobaculia bacterium]